MSFRPTFFAGVGCAEIYRSSATVQYPNDNVNAGSYNAVIATIPIGGSIMVYDGGDKAVEVNFTYTFGIPKKDQVNSNFTCFKGGLPVRAVSCAARVRGVSQKNFVRLTEYAAVQ